MLKKSRAGECPMLKKSRAGKNLYEKKQFWAGNKIFVNKNLRQGNISDKKVLGREIFIKKSLMLKTKSMLKKVLGGGKWRGKPYVEKKSCTNIRYLVLFASIAFFLLYKTVCSSEKSGSLLHRLMRSVIVSLSSSFFVILCS